MWVCMYNLALVIAARANSPEMKGEMNFPDIVERKSKILFVCLYLSMSSGRHYYSTVLLLQLYFPAITSRVFAISKLALNIQNFLEILKCNNPRPGRYLCDSLFEVISIPGVYRRRSYWKDQPCSATEGFTISR